ncbi:hypothetical protein BJY01DRAFT_243393 [Aspergillus pseudoustus]|uniref:Uncharacterized protein n=1 Tax=Aspergillus pseudoustus TaxID=1810923 RepID=A0ABR4KRP5_9EURO
MPKKRVLGLGPDQHPKRQTDLSGFFEKPASRNTPETTRGTEGSSSIGGHETHEPTSTRRILADCDVNKKRKRSSIDSVTAGKENMSNVPDDHESSFSEKRTRLASDVDGIKKDIHTPNNGDDDKEYDEFLSRPDGLDKDPSNADYTTSLALTPPCGGDDKDDEDYDELLPGPDGIDDDLFKVVVTTSVVNFVPRNIDPHTSNRFAQKMQIIITHMSAWTKSNNAYELEDAQRPMTIGFSRIIGRLSVSDIVAIFVAGISAEVQSLFEKPKLTAEDLLGLPNTRPVRKDKRQGIYLDLALGDIEFRGGQKIKCDGYVGSAGKFERRTGEHDRIAELYGPEDLPNDHKSSLHYHQICRPGVRNEFRRLAVFDKRIQPGYLLILESFFIIALDTFKFNGSYKKYGNKASFDFVQEIQETVNLPRIDWQGMNAALPLRQGFRHPAGKLSSPCANPDCEVMTYPNFGPNRPADASPTPRHHLHPGDPLGPYICGACADYLYLRKKLPNKDAIARREELARRKELRKKNNWEEDAPCGCCGRWESQVYTYPGTRHSSVHQLYPDALLCTACDLWIQRNNRRRTDHEVNVLLLEFHLEGARNLGENIQCENEKCRILESDLDCNGYPHEANSRSALVLCHLCARHYNEIGVHRPRLVIDYYRANCKMKRDRENGARIQCHYCGAIEPKGTPKKKQFFISKSRARVCCKPCKGKFNYKKVVY